MQFDHLKRRDFIAALGGAAAAWPLVAQAQEVDRMRRLGALLPARSDDREFQARLGAFLRGLQQLGWVEARNVRIDVRWGVDAAELQKHAEEMVALAPDALMAFTSAAVPPLRRVTRTIPIVFAVVTDPVGAGFVESLGQPGANVEGGGLISYGPNFLDQCNRAATYVDRILKGEKPSSLPVQAPTKYELVMNLKTAKELGITIPPTLLARADEVIE
jgi:putative tryptophan/tyrosine transport system substrate-binding protein